MEEHFWWTTIINFQVFYFDTIAKRVFPKNAFLKHALYTKKRIWFWNLTTRLKNAILGKFFYKVYTV